MQTATQIAESLDALARMSKAQRARTLRLLEQRHPPRVEVSPEERESLVEALRSAVIRKIAVVRDRRPHQVKPARREADAEERAARLGEQEYQKLRERFTTESLSRHEAARALDLTDQQISNLVKDGHLLALEVRRNLRIPRFQFDPRQKKGYLPGLQLVSNAYGGPPLAVLEWLTTRHPALDGKTPATALADGQLKRVLALAGAGQARL